MGQHWYDDDGTPRHFEGPNGGNTTLREARKLLLRPSVTTIGNVKNKYNLNIWNMWKCALMAIRILFNLKGNMSEWCQRVIKIINDEEYAESWLKSVVLERHFAETKALADEGTEIHDVLERWFSGDETMSVESKVMCTRVSDALFLNCENQDWTPEQRFCDSDLGYAGMCDLHSDDWVVDFKTKDGDVSKVRGYKEQAEQLAAYAHGLGIPNARTANVFISRDRELWGQPGGVKFFEHKDDNAWNRFYHTLLLWQVENKYGPLWEALNEQA